MNSFITRAVVSLGLVVGMGSGAGCAANTDPPADPQTPAAPDEAGHPVVDPDDGVENTPEQEAKLLSGEVADASDIAFAPPAAGAQLDVTASLQAFTPGTLPDVGTLESAPADDAPESQSAENESTPESAGTPVEEADARAVAAQKAAGRLGYAGGPVMEHQNVYMIYYGNWKNTTRTRSLLHAFVNSLHYNNFNHNFTKGLEYRDRGGHFAGSKGIRLAGAVAVGYPYGRNLHNGATADIVHSVLNAGKFSPDKNGIYVVMRSEDVGGDSPVLACGWHSNQTMNIRFQDNYHVTADIKFATIHHPARPVPGGFVCSAFYGSTGARVRTPNRDWVADSAVNNLSHEMLETMSDPDGNAWRNLTISNGQVTATEGSDMCAWQFQSRRKVNGSSANIYDRHEKRWWLIQSELQNNAACNMGPLR